MGQEPCEYPSDKHWAHHHPAILVLLFNFLAL